MSNLRTKIIVGDIEEEIEITEITELTAVELFLKILNYNYKED